MHLNVRFLTQGLLWHVSNLLHILLYNYEYLRVSVNLNTARPAGTKAMQ